MDKLKFKVKALETIDRVYEKVEELDSKREGLNDSLKKNYDKQKAALNKRRSELKKRLNKIESLTEENWEETKEVISESLKHYRAGFTELGRFFKKN